MKYEVKVKRVYTTIISVEADAPWDAKDKAAEILRVGKYSDGSQIPTFKPENTLPQVEWGFWEI
jgi:hypothetical protein